MIRNTRRSFFLSPVRLVRQGDNLVVERVGKFHRVLTPGFRFVWPLIEGGMTVSRQTHVVAIEPQGAVTNDHTPVSMGVSAWVTVKDPFEACYNQRDLNKAISQLLQSLVRTSVGQRSITDMFNSRHSIREQIAAAFDEATTKWGVSCTGLEIQNIDVSPDTRKSMEHVTIAQREREAAMTNADAEFYTTQRVADAKYYEAIKAAEAQRDAKLLLAKGDADAVRTLAEVTTVDHTNAMTFVLARAGFETLKDLGAKGNTFILGGGKDDDPMKQLLSMALVHKKQQ